MAIEIVDLPSYKMVDLSSSLCKRLPFRVLVKMLESPTEKWVLFMKPYRFHLVLRGGDSNISPKGCGSNKAVSTDIFLGLRKSSVKKNRKKTQNFGILRKNKSTKTTVAFLDNYTTTCCFPSPGNNRYLGIPWDTLIPFESFRSTLQ